MKKIYIIFMSSWEHKKRERDILNYFKEKHKNYIFETLHCLGFPSTQQVASANIIICYARSFNEDYARIKKIVKTNPNTWFAVRSHLEEHREEAIKHGVKHCIYQSYEGISESAVDIWLLEKYLALSNEERMLGAGFNI